MSGDGALPDEAYVVALLTLPGLWPARLAALLGQRRVPRSGGGRSPGGPQSAEGLWGAGDGGGGPGAEGVWGAGSGPVGGARGPRPLPSRRSPEEAWEMVRSGGAASDPAVTRAIGPRAGPEATAAGWASAARRVDVAGIWDAHRRACVGVDLLGAPSYPAELASDRAAPYAVFRAGRSPSLAGPCAAIVGTRRCTPAGAEVAAEFGRALAVAGVRVVSGLALGIDAAAHQGALEAAAAPPIGVVAGGFDVPYPVRHRVLWAQVAAAGVLVSEWPLGTRSEGWRFPARNRIIAALADVVVVVESRETGGSMITAEEAIDRDVPVLAVPGSIRSAPSGGTNKLLRDGIAPACGIEDVLAVLSISSAGRPARHERPPPPSPAAAAVLAAVGWEPTSAEALLGRTGLERSTLAVHLAHLELDGWVAGGGGWWQRLAADADAT